MTALARSAQAAAAARWPGATAATFGAGRSQSSRRVREALQVRRDLLRVAVDDADRLEDAVAALGAQLSDAERGRGGIDCVKRVGEVGAGVVGCRGVDHEREAPVPCSEPTAPGGIAAARARVTLDEPGRSNPGLHILPLRAAFAPRGVLRPGTSLPERSRRDAVEFSEVAAPQRGRGGEIRGVAASRSARVVSVRCALRLGRLVVVGEVRGAGGLHPAERRGAVERDGEVALEDAAQDRVDQRDELVRPGRRGRSRDDGIGRRRARRARARTAAPRSAGRRGSSAAAGRAATARPGSVRAGDRDHSSAMSSMPCWSVNATRRSTTRRSGSSRTRESSAAPSQWATRDTSAGSSAREEAVEELCGAAHRLVEPGPVASVIHPGYRRRSSRKP